MTSLQEDVTDREFSLSALLPRRWRSSSWADIRKLVLLTNRPSLGGYECGHRRDDASTSTFHDAGEYRGVDSRRAPEEHGSDTLEARLADSAQAHRRCGERGSLRPSCTAVGEREQLAREQGHFMHDTLQHRYVIAHSGQPAPASPRYRRIGPRDRASFGFPIGHALTRIRRARPSRTNHTRALTETCISFASRFRLVGFV